MIIEKNMRKNSPKMGGFEKSEKENVDYHYDDSHG